MLILEESFVVLLVDGVGATHLYTVQSERVVCNSKHLIQCKFIFRGIKSELTNIIVQSLHQLSHLYTKQKHKHRKTNSV